MRHVTIILALLGPLASPLLAVPVDPNAEDGIAALYVDHYFVQPGINARQLSYSISLILGTDGIMYQSVYPFSLGKWIRIVLEWPVPFADIVDWTPDIVDVPTGTFDIGFGPGYIQTRTGERWRYEIKDKVGGWDLAGQEKAVGQWVKISLDAIKKKLE